MTETVSSPAAAEETTGAPLGARKRVKLVGFINELINYDLVRLK